MKKLICLLALISANAFGQIAATKWSTCVEFTQPDVPITASPITLTARASSGVAVTFSSKTPLTCSVANGRATLKLAGVCTLIAKSAATPAYMGGQTPLSFAITAVIAPPPTPWTIQQAFFAACGPCPSTGKIETQSCAEYDIGLIDPAGAAVSQNMRWIKL